MTAGSDVYCNVVKNLDEFNIVEKTLFTSMCVFSCLKTSLFILGKTSNFSRFEYRHCCGELIIVNDKQFT